MAPIPFELTRAHRKALIDLQGLALAEDAWTPSMVDEEFDRPGAVLLGVGTPLAGFLSAWIVLGELHLLLIAVHPAARRQGLARALHARMLDHARGRAEVGWLEVRADNDSAIALYEGLGWRPIGRRPRYYADGADAVVMRLAPLHQPAANR